MNNLMSPVKVRELLHVEGNQTLEEDSLKDTQRDLVRDNIRSFYKKFGVMELKALEIEVRENITKIRFTSKSEVSESQLRDIIDHSAKHGWKVRVRKYTNLLFPGKMTTQFMLNEVRK